MELIALSLEKASSQWEFLSRLESENHFVAPCYNISFNDYVNSFLPKALEEAKGINLKEGYVPQSIFIAYENDIPVGVAKIRHYCNASLRNGAGHIGYYVAKEHRGKGYAKIILQKAFETLLSFPDFCDEYIFLSVDKSNIPSIKTQLGAGMVIFREDDEKYYTLYDYHQDGGFKDSAFDPYIYGSIPFETKGKEYPQRLIICFFHEQIRRLEEEKKIYLREVIKGENDLYIYQFVDEDILIVPGLVGGPLCGGFLEELIAGGVKKVFFIGGAGVLNKGMDVGGLMLVEAALRDEGFSYHYAPASRKIRANLRLLEKNEAYLKQKQIPYRVITAYTTDAFYRETKRKIAQAKEDGASAVEMEQAGLIALALLRGVEYSAILYGGDDLSGEEWDKRGWHGREDVRSSLIGIAKDLLIR